MIENLRAEGQTEGVDPIAEGLAGLSVVTARAEEEAATIAALLLRETLETPGKTAALVAPDQTLARRVAAKLARWGVGADSSAGLALSGCPGGALAGQAAAMVHAVRPAAQIIREMFEGAETLLKGAPQWVK